MSSSIILLYLAHMVTAHINTFIIVDISAAACVKRTNDLSATMKKKSPSCHDGRKRTTENSICTRPFRYILTFGRVSGQVIDSDDENSSRKTHPRSAIITCKYVLKRSGLILRNVILSSSIIILYVRLRRVFR